MAGGGGSPAGASQGGGGNPGSPAGGVPAAAAAVQLPGARLVHEGRFVTSQRCAECHANAPLATALRDSAQREVAPFDLWRASMMANAARDPLFRAQVSVEIAATPALAAAIPQKCLTCHAPAAASLAAAAGQALSLAELSQDSARSQVALDGVTCTLCHAIQPDLQNVATSFGGRLSLGPAGQLFGPHLSPFATPMVNRSGFTPVSANHLRASGLCAS